MGLPLSFIILFISWTCITKILFRKKNIPTLGNDLILEEKGKLGKIKREEKIVLVIFILMALSWIFRRDVNIGDFHFPGWSGFLSRKKN